MKFAMLTSIAAALVLAPCTFGKEQGCGGLLEGDNGKFRYKPQAAADGKSPANCVWLVQAYGATKIQMTLDEFLPGGDNNAVIFYPDTQPGQTDLNPITLNAQNSNSSLAFTWDSSLPDGFNPNDSVTIADYIEVPDGELTWTPARRQEKLWWIIGVGISAGDSVVEWKTQVDLSDCDRNRPCSCLSFEAFELSTDGYLLEVSRTCGRTSSGVFQMQSSPLVVAASASTTVRGTSKVELRWVQEGGSQPSTTSPINTTSSTTITTTSTAAPPEIPPSIYFTTWGRGISAFSLETSQVNKIVNSTELLLGIMHDSINNKLYWSARYQIYRSNTDGSEVETVLNTNEYGIIHGMAFDWIGGNVYVSTGDGYVLACAGGATQTFMCYTVISDQGSAEGITLDPNEGLMYWVRYDPGSIHRAGMNGSNPLTLVTSLGYPYGGITIDFASRRLYWTEYVSDKIQSSDLDGSDIQLVLQLPRISYPTGIAVFNDRIYWGSTRYDKLESSTKDGQDVQTLYTEENDVYGITVVPALDHLATRANDCEGRNCSSLCVPTPTSFRCLA